jgi:hypothetical protein
MDYEPKKRLTPSKALRHAWMSEDEAWLKGVYIKVVVNGQMVELEEE